MIKNSKIILLYLILISCNSEEKKVVHYFKNGKIKDVEFYNSNDSILKKINYTENGSLDSEIYYKNGKVQISKFYQDSKLNLEYDFRDSLHSFQNFLFNGVLVFGKGKSDSKSRQVGWWTYKDSSGYIKCKSQFIIIEKEQYLNQKLIYSDGKLNLETSDYFNCKFVKNGPKKYLLLLKFNSSIKKGHKYKLWTSAEISPNFDNLKGIPLDSYVIEEKITNEITLHFPLDQRSIFRAVILDELVDSTKKTYIMPLMYINYKIEVK